MKSELNLKNYHGQIKVHHLSSTEIKSKKLRCLAFLTEAAVAIPAICFVRKSLERNVVGQGTFQIKLLQFAARL